MLQLFTLGKAKNKPHGFLGPFWSKPNPKTCLKDFTSLHIKLPK